MIKRTCIGLTVLAALIFSGCMSNRPSGGNCDAPSVAEIELEKVEMTPVKIVLSRDIPAGTPLRLRQGSRLRPVWVGIYQVTNVTAGGVSTPIELSNVPTYGDIKSRWGEFEKYGVLAVLTAPVDLPEGATLTVRGRRYDGIDLFRQRYAWRKTPAWLEIADQNMATAERVSKPLTVRMIAGPVEYMEAYRKADGRLLIQVFDKWDNPTDSTGLTYKICGDDGAELEAPAQTGCEITEIMLPAPLKDSKAIRVSDNRDHQCRASAVPLAIDGRSIFFGDIHTHTGFSDGDYPTDDAVKFARTLIGLDFAGPGDHISQQGDFAGLTTLDYSGFGRRFEEPGKFCRVPALETSCAGGHQLAMAVNFPTFVRLMTDYVKYVGPEADGMSSAAYYEALGKIMRTEDRMVAPVHPIGHAERWPDIYDKSHVGAAEIIHGGNSHEFHEAEPDWLAPARGAREESSIRYALAIGYRLAFLGGSDNHRGLPGQPMLKLHGMTAVQSESLDKSSIFRAIRNRRCYATTGARIVADATLNGFPIGSELKLSQDQPRKFRIVVRGTAPVAETQIIHCGKVLKSFPAAENTYDISIEWTDTPPHGSEAPENDYYYIRIRQTDGHYAFLSPFWIVD